MTYPFLSISRKPHFISVAAFAICTLADYSCASWLPQVACGLFDLIGSLLLELLRILFSLQDLHSTWCALSAAPGCLDCLLQICSSFGSLLSLMV
jgi:hypothetical protein